MFLTTPVDEIAAWLGLRTGLPAQPPRRNIQPGQQVAVVTPERQLREMRWGMIPSGRRNARGRPVLETIVNARGETLFAKSAFAGLGRAAVPVDGWYEWTGAARRKTAWRIRRVDGAPLLFAAVTGLWCGPGGGAVPQVATVTCAPSGDVRDYHHRMGVLLEPRDLAAWLDGDEAAAAKLIRSAPEGTLLVEPAGDVDWSGP
ncbi:SOS response-associated peptidase [Oceaniglobus roseus]|uniref:SOS response-associated peptidase n=1 Tax=Oceaniglobus roseus TaxID=1737570 RepID=UPI001FE7555C|nr:SOS response-associated peptidase [Kandeliimicrobium roseum]